MVIELADEFRLVGRGELAAGETAQFVPRFGRQVRRFAAFHLLDEARKEAGQDFKSVGHGGNSLDRRIHLNDLRIKVMARMAHGFIGTRSDEFRTDPRSPARPGRARDPSVSYSRACPARFAAWPGTVSG